MALPSFTLTGNLQEILGDVIGDELAETDLSRAIVQLQCNVPEDALIVWNDVAYVVQPVNALVDTDGNILNEDGDPLLLLAEDAGLSISDLQWRINISIPASSTPPLPGKRLRPWWIDAGEDGDIIDLSQIAPVPGTSVHPVTDAPPVLIDGGSL